MGLLSFMKNVGSKLTGGIKPETIEAKIKEDLGSQIVDIKATVEGDTVTLSGLCESNDAKEKAVLIAGNINGVASVSYFGLKVKAADQPQVVSAELPAEAAVSEPVAAKAGGTTPAPVSSQPTAAGTTEFYTIVSGDTLSKIAKKYYGDASKYPLIFEANREVIKHPDKIYPGQTIRIPK